MNLRSPLFSRPPLLLAFTTGFLPALLPAASDTWIETTAGSGFLWKSPIHWASGSGFANGVDAVANLDGNTSGAQSILLEGPITLGTLNLADPVQPFHGRTLKAGPGGRLLWEVGSGRALLSRTSQTNPNLTDLFEVPMTLLDDLEVRLPWINSGNGFRFQGAVEGAGGILLSATSYPETGGSTSQILDLTNPLNSFTGTVEVANGTLVYRGNIGLDTAGALGKSPSPIQIGGPLGKTGSGTPTLQNSTTAELRLQAGDDTSSYTFARDLDLSGNADSAAATGRLRFGLTGNGTGIANRNTLTVTGSVTLPSNDRPAEFLAVRQGQTLRFTGPIVTPEGANGAVFWGPLSPGISASDGRQNGTYRLSDLERTYSNPQILTGGSVILEGSVGEEGLASPIGTSAFSLSDGNGGNVFGANTEGPTRRLFLEKAGSSYARNLNPGAGTGSNLATAATISGVLPAVFQPRYGTSGNINLPNGYEFGGLNSSGSVTFSGNFEPGNVNVPVTGSAGGAGGTNPFSVIHNVAFTSITGGSAEVTGALGGSTPVTPGDAGTPGSPEAGNAMTVTINQFRNHPNLDNNLDGIPDPNAGQTTGTATGGTVIFSGDNTYSGSTEVLGGTLELRYSTSDTSKLPDDAPLILSGATVAVRGGTHSETVGSTRMTPSTANWIVRLEGAAPLQLGAISAGAGSSLDLQEQGIATTDTLNTDGILGPWATINSTDLARNATNGADGSITAFTDYINVTRLTGTKVIPNNPAAQVRIVEGTGSASNLTLAAATTTIGTLTHSAVGGASPAVIQNSSGIFGVGSILAAPGTGPLTINGGTLRPSQNGGSLVIRNASTGTMTVNSVLSDFGAPAGVTVVGPGKTILAGTNSWTGPTAIHGGTLQIGSFSGPTTLSSSSVKNQGVLEFRGAGALTYPGVIAGTGSLLKDGNGVLVLTGANTGTGSVSILAGAIQLGDGGVTGSLPAGSSLELTGNLTINRSNAAVQGVDFPVSLSGSGNLIKQGAGTLFLNSANAITGSVQVDAGVLAASHPTAMGPDGETLILSDGTLSTGGRVSFSDGITVSKNLRIEGPGDGSTDPPAYNAAVNATAGTNTLTGTVTLTGSQTYRLSSSNAGTIMNYTKIIREAGGSGGLILDPSAGAVLTVSDPILNNDGFLVCHAGGRVILKAAGNDVGEVAVQNGTTLQIGATDALRVDRNVLLGQNATNLANGVNNDVGTLDLAGNNQTIGALNGTANAGTEQPNNATPSSSRLITNSASSAVLLTVGNGGGSGVFDGTISGGVGFLSLKKTGSGTQTLNGILAYTGETIVEDGTLALGPDTRLPDTGTVRISGENSRIELAEGVTDLIGALYLDGVVQTANLTYGSTTSGAQIQNDTWFSGSGVLSVAGSDAYTSWAASFGLQNPWLGADPLLNGSPAADPDGDGTANRLEYIFGLNPVSGASSTALVSNVNPVTGIFQYQRRLPAQTGAVFQYQWSTDVTAPWTTYNPVSSTSDGATPVEVMSVRIPDALLSNPRLFLRILVP